MHEPLFIQDISFVRRTVIVQISCQFYKHDVDPIYVEVAERQLHRILRANMTPAGAA